jgi:hypothetical protein
MGAGLKRREYTPGARGPIAGVRVFDLSRWGASPGPASPIDALGANPV